MHAGDIGWVFFFSSYFTQTIWEIGCVGVGEREHLSMTESRISTSSVPVRLPDRPGGGGVLEAVRRAGRRPLLGLEVPEEDLEEFRRSGFYATQVRPGLRAVAVNSNMCATRRTR